MPTRPTETGLSPAYEDDDLPVEGLQQETKETNMLKDRITRVHKDLVGSLSERESNQYQKLNSILYDQDNYLDLDRGNQSGHETLPLYYSKEAVTKFVKEVNSQHTPDADKVGLPVILALLNPDFNIWRYTGDQVHNFTFDDLPNRDQAFPINDRFAEVRSESNMFAFLTQMRDSPPKLTELRDLCCIQAGEEHLNKGNFSRFRGLMKSYVFNVGPTFIHWIAQEQTRRKAAELPTEDDYEQLKDKGPIKFFTDSQLTKISLYGSSYGLPPDIIELFTSQSQPTGISLLSPESLITLAHEYAQKTDFPKVTELEISEIFQAILDKPSFDSSDFDRVIIEYLSMVATIYQNSTDNLKEYEIDVIYGLQQIHAKIEESYPQFDSMMTGAEFTRQTLENYKLKSAQRHGEAEDLHTTHSLGLGPLDHAKEVSKLIQEIDPTLEAHIQQVNEAIEAALRQASRIEPKSQLPSFWIDSPPPQSSQALYKSHIVGALTEAMDTDEKIIALYPPVIRDRYQIGGTPRIYPPTRKRSREAVQIETGEVELRGKLAQVLSPDDIIRSCPVQRKLARSCFRLVYPWEHHHDEATIEALTGFSDLLNKLTKHPDLCNYLSYRIHDSSQPFIDELRELSDSIQNTEDETKLQQIVHEDRFKAIFTQIVTTYLDTVADLRIRKSNNISPPKVAEARQGSKISIRNARYTPLVIQGLSNYGLITPEQEKRAISTVAPTDIELAPRKVVLITGAVGVGKSTTLKVISDSLHPTTTTRGAISIPPSVQEYPHSPDAVIGGNDTVPGLSTWQTMAQQINQADIFNRPVVLADESSRGAPIEYSLAITAAIAIIRARLGLFTALATHEGSGLAEIFALLEMTDELVPLYVDPVNRSLQQGISGSYAQNALQRANVDSRVVTTASELAEAHDSTMLESVVTPQYPEMEPNNREALMTEVSIEDIGLLVALDELTFLSDLKLDRNHIVKLLTELSEQERIDFRALFSSFHDLMKQEKNQVSLDPITRKTEDLKKAITALEEYYTVANGSLNVTLLFDLLTGKSLDTVQQGITKADSLSQCAQELSQHLSQLDVTPLVSLRNLIHTPIQEDQQQIVQRALNERGSRYGKTVYQMLTEAISEGSHKFEQGLVKKIEQVDKPKEKIKLQYKLLLAIFKNENLDRHRYRQSIMKLGEIILEQLSSRIEAKLDKMEQLTSSEHRLQIASTKNAFCLAEGVLKRSKHFGDTFCKPRISPESGFSYIGLANYPLTRTIGAEEYVPADMPSTGSTSVVYSGLNGGGKSEDLRAVALALTLFELLDIVPAKEFTIPARPKEIRTRLRPKGDSRLSTFTQEAKDIARIAQDLERKGSYVLIDELGTGVRTVDGVATLLAVLQKLQQQGANMIAVTHFNLDSLVPYLEDPESFQITPIAFEPNPPSDEAPPQQFCQKVVGKWGGAHTFEVSLQMGVENEIIDLARQIHNLMNHYQNAKAKHLGF